MLAKGHRAAGAAAWGVATFTYLPPLPWWQVCGGLLVVMATSAGSLSPDIDQGSGLIATKILKGHRRIAHWLPVPLIGGAVLLAVLPPAGDWLGVAVTVGWCTHIVADGVFGRIPIYPRGRGRWMRTGLGLSTGGTCERWTVPPLRLLAIGTLLLTIAS